MFLTRPPTVKDGGRGWVSLWNGLSSLLHQGMEGWRLHCVWRRWESKDGDKEQSGKEKHRHFVSWALSLSYISSNNDSLTVNFVYLFRHSIVFSVSLLAVACTIQPSVSPSVRLVLISLCSSL